MVYVLLPDDMQSEMHDAHLAFVWAWIDCLNCEQLQQGAMNQAGNGNGKVYGVGHNDFPQTPQGFQKINTSPAVMIGRPNGDGGGLSEAQPSPEPKANQENLKPDSKTIPADEKV